MRYDDDVGGGERVGGVEGNRIFESGRTSLKIIDHAQIIDCARLQDRVRRGLKNRRPVYYCRNTVCSCKLRVWPHVTLPLLSCSKTKNVGKNWVCPGFEPGTSRTLSENHTPRPTDLAWMLPKGGVVSCRFHATLFICQKFCQSVSQSVCVSLIHHHGGRWMEVNYFWKAVLEFGGCTSA